MRLVIQKWWSSASLAIVVLACSFVAPREALDQGAEGDVLWQVKDSRGRARMSFEEDQGAVRLLLKDQRGGVRLALTIDAAGNPGVIAFDESAQQRVVLGSIGDNGWAVSVEGPNKTAASLIAAEDDSVGLTVGKPGEDPLVFAATSSERAESRIEIRCPGHLKQGLRMSAQRERGVRYELDGGSGLGLGGSAVGDVVTNWLGEPPTGPDSSGVFSSYVASYGARFWMRHPGAHGVALQDSDDNGSGLRVGLGTGYARIGVGKEGGGKVVVANADGKTKVLDPD